MEYYYQWPISKESPSMPEHKKWENNFWGKSARCMRRRGLCLPPWNYFPRGHRPQLNSTPFRRYDHSWKPMVPENHQPYCGMAFERTNKALPAPSYKKRPCHNRGNKKTSKPCDNERSYFPGASTQHIPGRYCGGPLINDVYFNAFDYQHHIVERGHDMSYDPYLDCSNGFSGFCESSPPMECVEERVKNPSYSGNCNDLLSTAVKVAIEEPLPELVDFLVPSVDACNLGQGILELPKDEAEAAAQTLEQLFPSLRFSSAEGLEEPHQFLNRVENSTTFQEEPKKERELEQEAGLLPPTQLSSVEKPIEQQETIGGSLEDSKPLTDSTIAQDSVQFLANQNQFLSDVLSQFMRGEFNLNQNFWQKYQIEDETQTGNAAQLHRPSPSPLVSSTENIIQKEENIIQKEENIIQKEENIIQKEENIIQKEDNNQEVRPFNDPGVSETLQCKDESKYLYKTIELSNIESEMNCNSSNIDWDSFDYVFGKYPEMKCEETTQNSTNTHSMQEVNLAFTKPNFVSEMNEAQFLRCVNPNAILKDKRPSKRVKRAITNVEVKTKRVRRNNKKDSKDDDEETMQSMNKTDVYTSTEEKDVHELLDAQTQVEEKVILKVDAETQWYDSEVEGGATSRNPLEKPPELNEFDIDVNFSNCDPFPMPTLENQNLAKGGNGVSKSKTDPDVYESLFRSLVVSVFNSNTDGKENKCFENEVDGYKIHDGAMESTTANDQNSTVQSGFTTEIFEDFLSDVLNCVPIKPNEDNLIKIQACKQDVQNSDCLEVAAYEVCSGESVSLVSILPAQDAVEATVTTTTNTVPGGFVCVEPGEICSSKSNESSLKSLETMLDSEVKTLDEQEYVTQTEGIEKGASNGKFPENEKECETAKLETTNQETLHFSMTEFESMESEETITMKGPTILDEMEQVEQKVEIFDIKNTPQEKSIDKNYGSLADCKVDILPLEVTFQCSPIPQSSSKNRLGRPRRKRTLKETKPKSRKTAKPSRTPLSQEIVIPQVNTPVQKRTTDSVSDQPPFKKRRLASLRCRPEFQKMM